MKKVGITGQNGFVGYHLYQSLKLYPEEFVLIDFERSFFDNEELLDSFVKQCDVIVHLAALNRHSDPNIIFDTNIELVNKLITALKRTQHTPHVIISSSTQEERDNIYGKSKREARSLLFTWAEENKAVFTGMIIPNVFGPFGRPFYNSVIATFCDQVARNDKPFIEVDNKLNLIYVGELVEEIIHSIRIEFNNAEYYVKNTTERKVSEILDLILKYKYEYQDQGKIPLVQDTFEHQLFNTYRCYMGLRDYFPKKFTKHSDSRGSFVEIIRLGIGGQVSYSTTYPGITRGNHFHTRKIERFAVINGKALIQLRRIGSEEVIEFYLDGEEPAYVDMPIWYTHNIKNIGNDTLYTIFWIDEPFDPENADTYFENV